VESKLLLIFASVKGTTSITIKSKKVMRIKLILFVGAIIMIIATLMKNSYISALLIGVAVVVISMAIAYIFDKCKLTKGENKFIEKLEYYLGF
jgi:uncharacterized membrane protein YobD (UPF0266 family)